MSELDDSIKRMDEFFETHSWVGEIEDWRAFPEFGEEDDEDLTVLGGKGSGIKGHTTAHDNAVQAHKQAEKRHREKATARISITHGTLTDGENGALGFWIEEPGTLNENLRAGTADENETQQAELLTSAIQRSVTTVDSVLLRGLMPDLVDKLEVGKTFTDNGLTSLTTSRKVAFGFTQEGYFGEKPPETLAKGRVFEVLVPVGTNVLDVARAVKEGEIYQDTDRAEIEKEHLLAPGTTFKVLSLGEKNVLQILPREKRKK